VPSVALPDRTMLCICRTMLRPLQGVRHFDGPQEGEFPSKEATHRSDRRGFNGLAIKGALRLSESRLLKHGRTAHYVSHAAQTPATNSLNVHLPELRDYLERAREVFASHHQEPVSTAEVCKLLLESAIADHLDDRLAVAELRIRPAEALWTNRCNGSSTRICPALNGSFWPNAYRLAARS